MAEEAQDGRAELKISAEQARAIAELLRYVISLNTTAGLLSPTERRLTTPTYRAVELAARALEGETLEEALEGCESSWTGSLEHDYERSLEILLEANRNALRDAMSALLRPDRFAQYLTISQEQFLELVKSGMQPLLKKPEKPE
ncbi:hypothetical protein GBA65_16655 [Rubrobacter marinus]|uniref:Uncharacterized protein n=1 Tax=Rubrobacter marinus TaxID=2653852 RepID=A0A6G8Q0D3_9ACTN|nr:hypothetical protein [Rubrobacter marinus]QIN79888.1 hypothetical protein GBA65_16655 [Rubrobacter marinus]